LTLAARQAVQATIGSLLIVSLLFLLLYVMVLLYGGMILYSLGVCVWTTPPPCLVWVTSHDQRATVRRSSSQSSLPETNFAASEHASPRGYTTFVT